MAGPMPGHWRETARASFKGVLVCTVVALAATFVSEHYGGPVLLYALLLGLALHFLGEDPQLKPGIDFCARTLLRAGVALLGLRIGIEQVRALGWGTGLLAGSGVLLAITLGLLLARRLGRPREEGLISGCSVGICGASAALAVASVLPATRENERFTLMAVMGVTLMSTLSMVLYPALVGWAGFTPQQAGVFFGATIHDVAQVVGAGMMLSETGNTAAADSATVVKLFRVLLLLPVVLLVAAWYRRTPAAGAGPGAERPSLVPGFLLVFVAFVVVHSLGWVPATAERWAGVLSRELLVMAIVAAGLKTSLASFRALGWTPVLMLGAETLALAAWVGLVLWGL